MNPSLASSFPNIVLLESIVRRAPVAFRLMDAVFAQQVTEHLKVSAHRLDPSRAPALQLSEDARDARVANAQRSLLSGIYGFASLDGLAGYEWGRQPASDYCAGPGSPPNFAFLVEDRLGRFSPQALALCLPNILPADNLFELDLFSSPSRQLPDTFGVLRAEVWDAVQGRRAAWAVVKATFAPAAPAIQTIAVTDERGIASMFVPYPPLDQSPQFGTPPASNLARLTWPFTVQVHHAPALLRFVQQTNGMPIAGWPPTIASMLAQTSQPPNTIIIDRTPGAPAPEADHITVNLAFRSDTAVKTKGNDSAGHPLSRLLIKP